MDRLNNGQAFVTAISRTIECEVTATVPVLAVGYI